jgi:tRNA A37 threonylcarbamoyladenosine synthetase subunit TsaC/SUA5/YrdC
MKDIRSKISELLELLGQKDEPSWNENLYALKQKDYHKALETYCDDCDNFSPVTEWR